MSEILATRFDHKTVEERIYKLWERSGYFNPDTLTDRRKSKSFCIVMPPPNANGSLHLGHAVFITLQDIIIRFQRMCGKRTLWLPGADHAGFETQVVFDKKLEQEGRSRFGVDRGSLFREIWDFTQQNKKTMESQLRKLGASCDWSREKFTLDRDIIGIVYKTFAKLYEEGLIYRGLRVINWCPKHKTALSDLEIKYVERKDPLYYIKYGPLTLATVRPETKFGDMALAVNPKDKRYKKYIGQEVEATGVLGKLKFKVIADEAVDPRFGTGVIKVTPAHDLTDFEIWQRHKDEIPGLKPVIDEDGRLSGEVGEFKGLKIAEARVKIIEVMKEKRILEKIDLDYLHQVATCYKCGTVLEPIPKPQWFVKMKPLAKEAIKVVKQKKIKFYPERTKKIYLHWLENIRDWNISRQIIWGIRIPAWFCECGEIIVSKTGKTPARCPICNSRELSQDPDVLDTWFSSGQWPFATLMTTRPKKRDFRKFYPTEVMETGHDILFFWVARMVMLGLYCTKKLPFKRVYLNGLVLDKNKQKISKSRGNIIDPLTMTAIYGSDALRMALIVGNPPGKDFVLSEEKIRSYRNFTTKIWNIARFILFYQPSDQSESEILSELSIIDKKNIKQARKIKNEVAKHVEKFEFHLAAEKIYRYLWHIFADKIIEAYKPRLKSINEEESRIAYRVLEIIFFECLSVLHPFMPFITEEIYQKFRPGELLMVKKW